MNRVKKMEIVAGILKEVYKSMREDLNISKNDVPQIRKGSSNLSNTGDETNLAKILGSNQTVSKALKRIDQPATELDGAFATIINSFGLDHVDAGVIRAQLEKVLKNLKDPENKITSAPNATGKNQVNLSKNPVPQVRKTGGLR